MDIDNALRARMNQIGPFVEETVSSLETEFTWEAPPRLANELTPLELRFRIEADRDTVDVNQALEHLLDAWDSLHMHFASGIPEFRTLLLEHFHRHAAEGEPGDFDEELDGGYIQLTWWSDRVQAIAHFFVEWDEEHGAEYEVSAQGEITPL